MKTPNGPATTMRSNPPLSCATTTTTTNGRARRPRVFRRIHIHHSETFSSLMVCVCMVAARRVRSCILPTNKSNLFMTSINSTAIHARRADERNGLTVFRAQQYGGGSAHPFACVCVCGCVTPKCVMGQRAQMGLSIWSMAQSQCERRLRPRRRPFSNAVWKTFNVKLLAAGCSLHS